MEERKRGDMDDERGMAVKEVKLLKQDITLLKDTLASGMTVLEATIPNGRKIEGRLTELDKS
eukprot:8169132-Prorocentrum_lima.AAC.1